MILFILLQLLEFICSMFAKNHNFITHLSHLLSQLANNMVFIIDYLFQSNYIIIFCADFQS